MKLEVYVASKLDGVDWLQRRESVGKVDGGLWRGVEALSDRDKGRALVQRRESPKSQNLQAPLDIVNKSNDIVSSLHSEGLTGLCGGVSPCPYNSGVERSSPPQKPGVEARTSWALPDTNPTS